jgi:hypothetical protein
MEPRGSRGLFDDTSRAARAREEMECDRRATRRHGQPPWARPHSEVSRRTRRTTVTQRVRAAIQRIAQQQPALGDHLDGRIETGTFCVYIPDPTRAIAWDRD